MSNRTYLQRLHCLARFHRAGCAARRSQPQRSGRGAHGADRRRRESWWWCRRAASTLARTILHLEDRFGVHRVAKEDAGMAHGARQDTVRWPKLRRPCATSVRLHLHVVEAYNGTP